MHFNEFVLNSVKHKFFHMSIVNLLSPRCVGEWLGNFLTVQECYLLKIPDFATSNMFPFIRFLKIFMLLPFFVNEIFTIPEYIKLPLLPVQNVVKLIRGCLYGSRYIGETIYWLTDITFSTHSYEKTKVITHFG